MRVLGIVLAPVEGEVEGRLLLEAEAEAVAVGCFGEGDGMGAGVLRFTICAFCLRTSAGVRMRHDTNSPVEEAIEWVIGVGNEVCERRDLLAS